MIPRSSQRGFSLLEVMIATAILAASAMVLLSLISLGTRFG
ncbi:MAG: prepilin-type N-terminal cleavage/methylation domain-containing protein, partial [Pirellula sp.]